MLYEPRSFNIGYVSGMLDADGTIVVSNTEHPQVSITIYNNNLELINYCASIIGGTTRVGGYMRNDKMSYYLRINGDTRIDILEKIKLIMKDEKRVIALEILYAQRNKDKPRKDYLFSQWERINGKKLTKRKHFI